MKNALTFKSLPWGFCPACLDRLQTGDACQAAPIAGAIMVHAYCAHREVGASMLIRPDRPKRWKILTPIDVVEWEAYLKLRSPIVAEALRLMGETDASSAKPTVN